VVATDTYIAADAFANFLGAPLFNLLGQERIGNRRAGRPDQVQYATANQRHHGVRRSEAADAHHGLAGQRLEPQQEGLLVTLPGKARRHAVIGPIGDIDVPQVRQVRQHREDFGTFALAAEAVGHLLIHRQADRYGTPITHCVASVFNQLAQQAHTVFQRTAVFVGTPVIAWREEMERHAQVVAGVHIDDVETRLPGAQCGGSMQGAQLPDIGMAHGPSLHRVVTAHRGIGRRPGNFATVAVGRRVTIECQLYPGQRPVTVYPLTHARQCRNIAFIPKTRFYIRGELAQRADFAFFRAHHAPAALGFHCAHARHRRGVHVAHAITVRNLIKAIAGTHRAYLHRFKQNVIARIAHRATPEQVSSLMTA